ncbi:sulfatase [Nitrosopumilus sp.]|uniref:sulfatase n=1 Tax=Nitrosopumilus sp. TaxID=2024843 RepID=UPI00349FFA9B
MTPNILFITIDSLRSDRCYGKNKSSILPCIESLIDKGVYFSQNFVSVAQTMTSLSSIFTSVYPIKSKNIQSNFNKISTTYFDFLKNNNYYTCCCVPDLYFLKEMSTTFDDQIVYPYVETTSHIHISDDLGKNILDKLNNFESSIPWIFYIHLMDLKDPKVGSSNFDNSKYGKSSYEKNLSIIDVWLGKIINKIDFSNTLVIVSADHGKYIPVNGKDITDIPTIQKIMSNGKKILPFLTPLGVKCFHIFQKFAKKTRERKLKSVYTDYEMRSFTNEINSNLYDEILNTPLIITGCGINSSKPISEMVRSIDIFPTIIELIGLKNNMSTKNGRSLLPLINGAQFDEIPIYLQSPIYPTKLNDTVGIRTSKFKYFRNREDQSKDIHLFDLQNDPQEITNVAHLNKKIIDKMEFFLNNIYDNFSEMESQEFSDQELKKIEDELHKLGYM